MNECHLYVKGNDLIELYQKKELVGHSKES